MATPRRTSQRLNLPSPVDTTGVRWLLLIHQIPPKPDYLRVKIGRRLQRVGAIAIKNSVYVLPVGPQAREDFQWIMREIRDSGGEAFVSEASLEEGLTDEAVRARFDAARNEVYGEILADAKALTRRARQAAAPVGASASRRASDAGPSLEHELAQLRRRYDTASAIDFFGAARKGLVVAALAELEAHARVSAPTARQRQRRKSLEAVTWVTRRDIRVDRMASAWLIRRFIDRRPRFRFVAPEGHRHRDGEIRFDMFEAEYTHVGDACTFETLALTFQPHDRALREIGEIVHDIDCNDAKFGREEAPGLARMIAGVVALCAADEDRVERGTAMFDELYAAFGGRGGSP